MPSRPVVETLQRKRYVHNEVRAHIKTCTCMVSIVTASCLTLSLHASVTDVQGICMRSIVHAQSDKIS